MAMYNRNTVTKTDMGNDANIYAQFDNQQYNNRMRGNIDIRSMYDQLGSVQEEQVNVNVIDDNNSSVNSTNNTNLQSNVGSEKATSAISTTTKVMIASYIAAVLALIVAIVFSTMSVSSTFGNVVIEQQQYDQLAAQLATLTENATEIEYAEMYEKAISLGFVPVSEGNSYTFTKLETRPAQNYNIEGNWFDTLCDWVSGVFGG